ncbi:YsnF/AvaK domain-containing protein [Rubrivirga sp. S365]|uniref:YsnF/AvaK domain-containing protein n=1 Tax=Rubrivirga litoralis TaxID=3075598 RepID=A0ABU3BSJ6_9BACT|nr:MULTISPECIES: YsnF/AvaK domain-containing protein [unclassified Rubrivirga]MDT0632252.1 YsnF/AvaK domain-containing protein [Rubrivirga sp. F394]MDT7856378.1 YsnF/AvaK domain-containing protein [Rubrivirga sp. S365]
MSVDSIVLDRDGESGAVESVADGRVRVRLAGGAVLDLPEGALDALPDGTYRTDLAFGALASGESTTLQEVEERLAISSRVRETGRVVARTVTETVDEPVDGAGWRETVDVERVPVGREVDAAEPPREEGDVTIIPVYEEVLVVQKRLVLREEIRLTTRRTPTDGPTHVTLRRQRVEVERLPPSDAGPADG